MVLRQISFEVGDGLKDCLVKQVKLHPKLYYDLNCLDELQFGDPRLMQFLEVVRSASARYLTIFLLEHVLEAVI